MAIRVTCISRDGAGGKDDTYTGISSFGWIEDETAERGLYTREDMYLWLVSGGHGYVQNTTGRKTYLIAMQTEDGFRYVKTTEDNPDADDLLLVPPCAEDADIKISSQVNKAIRTISKLEPALLPVFILSYIQSVF